MKIREFYFSKLKVTVYTECCDVSIFICHSAIFYDFFKIYSSNLHRKRKCCEFV